MRNLIAERAREEYSALVESTGILFAFHSHEQCDIVYTTTGSSSAALLALCLAGFMWCLHIQCWLTPVLQPSSWYAGHSENDTDFITTLRGLFKDIATAVEENHDMLLGSFGAPFLVNFILGLQAECDMQVRH